MKKIMLITLVLVIVATCSFGSVAYAQTEENPQIMQSTTNRDVQNSNQRLDNLTKITQNDLNELRKYSDVTIKQLDDKQVELTVENKIPEQITTLSDGANIQTYSTSVIVANYGETYTDLDVQFYVKMNYSKYANSYGYNFCKLNYGYGKLVECWESQYRNLKISNGVYGGWEDVDGSTGYTTTVVTNSTTIASPTKGAEYSLASPSSHYYAVDSSNGVISVKVSIDWRHGTSWYTTSYYIKIGNVNLW